MADLSLAYRKTPAGVRELAAKALGLSREQRNLLILADGRHSLSDWCKAGSYDPDRLGALADGLLELDLIEPGSHRPMDAGRSAGVAEPTADSDPAALRARLLDLVGSIFGTEGKPMQARIERAEATRGELMAAAERAAVLAKLTIDEERAGIFMNEVRKILGA